jgi:hypothetical protein
MRTENLDAFRAAANLLWHAITDEAQAYMAHEAARTAGTRSRMAHDDTLNELLLINYINSDPPFINDWREKS